MMTLKRERLRPWKMRSGSTRRNIGNWFMLPRSVMTQVLIRIIKVKLSEIPQKEP